MAIVPMPGPYFKISSTLTPAGATTFILGTGSDASPSAMEVEIVDTGSLSATITVVSRSASVQATQVDNIAFTKTVYGATFLNGTVSDGSIQSVDITTTSKIIIPCSGDQVALLVNYTSGTATVYKKPIIGPSVF